MSRKLQVDADLAAVFLCALRTVLQEHAELPIGRRGKSPARIRHGIEPALPARPVRHARNRQPRTGNRTRIREETDVPCLLIEMHRPSIVVVIVLVIARAGINAIFRAKLLNRLEMPRDAARLTVRQIAREADEIGLQGVDLIYHRLCPPAPCGAGAVKIRELHDAVAVKGSRQVGILEFDLVYRRNAKPIVKTPCREAPRKNRQHPQLCAEAEKHGEQRQRRENDRSGVKPVPDPDDCRGKIGRELVPAERLEAEELRTAEENHHRPDRLRARPQLQLAAIREHQPEHDHKANDKRSIGEDRPDHLTSSTGAWTRPSPASRQSRRPSRSHGCRACR